VLGRKVRLARRPRGLPREDDFELAEVDVPAPRDEEVLIRNAFLSVDPYMRGRMHETPSYAPPFPLGQVLPGGAVGEVIVSRNERWPEGTWVEHALGWRELALSDGSGLRALDPALAPVSTALGVLGMPGFTAWFGLHRIARPRPGETILVSAAAGAVGSVVGQLAKRVGLRVIGAAGGPEKVAWLWELGFDHAFDYRTADVRAELAGGIDVYFDNVGGDLLEAALDALRDHGRVVACGMISRYNDERPRPGPRTIGLVVTKRLRIEGFIIRDHEELFPVFLAEVAPLVRDGTLRYRETIVDGLEHAPRAFIGLLEGANVGKALVRL
jgi:NADPH-dependent curcumin reductase CurA